MRRSRGGGRRRVGAAGVSLGLGLAYSRTAPGRTVLDRRRCTRSRIFTLTLLVTIGQLYSHNVDARRPPARRRGRARGDVGRDAAGAGPRRRAAAGRHPRDDDERDRRATPGRAVDGAGRRSRSSASTRRSSGTARRRSAASGRATRCSPRSPATPRKVIVGADLRVRPPERPSRRGGARRRPGRGARPASPA